MSGLSGDWKKLKKALNGFTYGNTKYQEIVEDFAVEIAIKVVEYIESQSLDFAPLAEDYRQKKIREGYDPRILIKTSDYVNSIEVKRIESDGDKVSAFIGVVGGKTETGIDMTELAYYIEYGTANQPPRLPFTQSWEMMKGEIRKGVAKKIQLEIEGGIR